ncbi:MAG: S8 family serine peptidase [Alkalinema sp. RU_4_3]|nr:S8 family serine peptidase [Alkalinema sp. RU_4_3]
MFPNTTTQNPLETSTALNLETPFEIALNTNQPSASLAIDPGSTLTTARNLGVINTTGRITITDSVSFTGDRSDIYAFSLTSGSRTQITLSALAADADLRLIQDANNNGQIEANEVLRVSEFAGTRNDTIELSSLAIGNYFLEVSAYSGSTNYRLDISAAGTDTGSTIATASELGIINGNKTIPGTIGIGINGDPSDLYRFRITNDSNLQIDLTGLSSDADLYLIQDANNNGLIDTGETLGRSILSGNSPERISLNNLRSGTYFVEVSQYRGQSAYSLSISADSAGDTPRTARILDNIPGVTTTVREYVSTSDSEDFYRFFLNSNSNVEINLRNLTSDADLYLIRDANNNGLYDIGEAIDLSLRTGSQAEQISLQNLAAGNYFIRVRSFLGENNTNYTLDFRSTPNSTYRIASGTLGADRFTVTPGVNQTIISGNGNVDFGRGQYDILDLSNVASNSFREVNILGLNGGTGVALDLGNGTRLFDSLTLSNGQQILFEGIDRIQFSNSTFTLAVTPNDPLFSQQWNLHMMGVQNAWRFTQGSTRVTIGIGDTGLGVNNAGQIHPDLNLQNTFVLTGNDVIDDYFRTIRDDGYGPQFDSHGTLVQSVISSVANNNLGTAGINWTSSVTAVDILDGNTGDFTTAEAARQLIDSALANNQRLIINLSIGGGLYNPQLAALAAQYQDQVLFVISSGNSNVNQLDNPAGLARQFDNVVAVGGVLGRQDIFGNTTQPGTRFNYGALGGSNYGDGLTLMGPTEVLAATAIQSGRDLRFTTDPQFGGTSAAAPNVTGVASLIWSANPNLTAREVSYIMQDTAYDLNTPGYDSQTGSGLVNADAGVRRALAIAAGYA